MALDIKPWRCPQCNNTWFKQEQIFRIAQIGNAKMKDRELPQPYYEPGEHSQKTIYVCTQCERVLKELNA